ncbi:FkbM family methyltransferase [Methylobacterium sp. 174MFSha1.1]|uniref:FkbM family methyltransferase n=1 Tax=Methylobacterium sp. 174MFSha1.1 TaxID=1502749 RepID=UPI0015A5882F|nr:FkbM family methyltransferase [Methylobacterium sp. 174MFSha1.1]
MNATSPHAFNFALGKPANQSSVSQWSSSQITEVDASVATNGDTTSSRFFHTDNETSPWWQVDLGEDIVIEKLRLFNRREYAHRFRKFSILISPTGAPNSWLSIFSKNDNATFGGDDDHPYEAKFGGKLLARFVRIRKDDPGYLHFRECEVLGYKPDPEESALLRDQMAQTKQRLLAEKAAATQRLIEGRTGHITYIDSRAVFVDTNKYSTSLVKALDGGGYEDAERKIVKEVLLSKDRVLEIGTAVGMVSMTAAGVVCPSSVLTYDANPAIVADARRNFDANGMGEISANVGVMRNRSRWLNDETEIDFFVSRDFWASRLFVKPGDSDIASVVRVPLVCLEDKIADHQANVIICDIEGGEADLLNGADLSSIRLILIEIHYWAVGREKIDGMINYLISQGFSINFYYTSRNIVLLDRNL